MMSAVTNAMYKTRQDLVAAFPVWVGTEAKRDLAALVLILVGTALITLGGVPVAIRNLVNFREQKVVFGGQNIIHGSTSDSRAAVRRYLFWAIPGLIAITLGMALQALGPISVLWPDEKSLAVFRQG